MMYLNTRALLLATPNCRIMTKSLAGKHQGIYIEQGGVEMHGRIQEVYTVPARPPVTRDVFRGCKNGHCTRFAPNPEVERGEKEMKNR